MLLKEWTPSVHGASRSGLATCSLAFPCAGQGAELCFGWSRWGGQASAIPATPSPLPAAVQQELPWAVWPRDTGKTRVSSFILNPTWKTSVSKAHAPSGCTLTVNLHLPWQICPPNQNPNCTSSSTFCSHAHSCCQDSSWAQFHLLQHWGKGLRPSPRVTQDWGHKWITSYSWAFPHCWSSRASLTH